MMRINEYSSSEGGSSSDEKIKEMAKMLSSRPLKPHEKSTLEKVQIVAEKLET